MITAYTAGPLHLCSAEVCVCHETVPLESLQGLMYTPRGWYESSASYKFS